MNAHLADDGALAQRLFAEFGAHAGGAQRALPQLLDDDFGIQLGADNRNLGVPHVEFGEDLLGDVEHPVEVAVAARHAAAAEDDGAADLLCALDHVSKISLDRFSLEIFSAGSEVIRAGVHRAAVGDDRVDASLQGLSQRFLRVSVPERATGRNDAIDKLWHVKVPDLFEGGPNWLHPADCGEYHLTTRYNKYCFNMGLSASDIPFNRSIQRPAPLSREDVFQRSLSARSEPIRLHR